MSDNPELDRLRSDLKLWMSRLREAAAEADKLSQEMRGMERRIDSLAADVEMYTKLSEGTQALITKLDPNAVPPTAQSPALSDSGAPSLRGKEAVLRVMAERPGEWKQADVVNAVIQRRWFNPDAKSPAEALRVTIRRLIDAGEIERIERGLIRLPGPQPSLLNEEEVSAV